MIGWRGASRYYSEKYRAAFAVECKKRSEGQEEDGTKNVVVMIPFCRTVEERCCVLDTMKQNGLEKRPEWPEVYLMAEYLPTLSWLTNLRHIDGLLYWVHMTLTNRAWTVIPRWWKRDCTTNGIRPY